MGYTHYWDHPEINENDWYKLLNVCTDLLPSVYPLIRWESDSDLKAETSQKCIRFNGIGDDGYETFVLTKKSCTFAFCKTAHKPYDFIVVAVLTAAKECIKGFNWWSDGDPVDLEAGINLYLSTKELGVN